MSDSEHKHAGHSHGLSQGEQVRHVSDARLLWAVGLNQILTLAQVVAGLFSGSIALLSDAAHNFNDANALTIAYIARRISRKESNERFTFGYRRAELIGAIVNLTLLAVVGLYLVVEGTRRLYQPEPITGWIMAAASLLALIVDIGTALLLWTMSKGSLNVRAAFIHNLVDALGSLAVLVAAVAIMMFDWIWLDAILTIVIAGYVLWQVAVLFPKAARILMEGSPPQIDLRSLVKDIESIDGVENMHHLHVWELDENSRALEAHIAIQSDRFADLELIKHSIKERLRIAYGIGHSTLEFEHDDQATAGNHDTSMIVKHY